jgi:hypothetical protein
LTDEPEFYNRGRDFGGAQTFGEFVVQVNVKKRKKGDRTIIRVGRGTTAKKAESQIKTVLLADCFDRVHRPKKLPATAA